MNTKAFAVAAVFGASAALASECPDLGVFPDNYNDLNWNALAVKKFDYMDNCPKDGILSYMELVRYSGEVPKGLNSPEDTDTTTDKDYYFDALIRMDDNSNMVIELPEYLRKAQIVNEPIAESADEDEKFNYLTCKPQADQGEYHNCRKSYDRADLRQTIYMI